MEQTVQQAVPLLPDWTEDDFYGSGVYEWLWEQKDKSGFLFQRILGAAQKKARELRVIGFMKTWNEYVKSMVNPNTQILGANMTMFPDQPIQMECREYRCDVNGVCYFGKLGEKIDVIAHPILPIRLIENIDTGDERVQLAYSRGVNGKWRTIIVPKNVISSAQKIVKLSDNGIGITSENAKEVVKYLSNVESWNLNILPVRYSTSHLGWLPDGTFAPYAEGIEFDGDSPENKRMYDAFHTEGTYEEWLRIAKEARCGESVPARIALAGAFAAPLVPLCNALPFLVHFWGTSGMGKSVALMLSASVWAEPTVGGAYIKTFGSTKVAQEMTAAFLGNVPMYLDELQIISDRKSFDDIIYMLCEGSSKGRGSKDGGLQLARHWSNCIMSTGEMPIVQSNSGGGASVRTIEVGYGGIPLFRDGRDVSNRLKSNYGWAGPAFIDALKDENLLKKAQKYQKDYEKALSGDIHGKQVLSASVLLAADAIADEVIFHDGKSLTIEDIKPYLITNEQADVNRRCYQWLMGFAASNPKRFETSDNNGELWGVREDDTIYWIRTAFDKALLENGFSPVTFLGWAKIHGKIQCESYGTGNQNNRLTKRKQINGHATVCVALKMDEKDDSDEPEKKSSAAMMDVTDEPLPFMDEN